jgi:PPOX class probable F420-dependent enzyme
VAACGYPLCMPSGPLPKELSEFLAKPNPAVIATLNRDGAPNTVATWYLWDDGRVLVNMDENRARLINMRRDPRVSLTVLGQDSWYKHVSLRGRVVSIEPDEDLSDIDRLCTHYMGQPYSDRDRDSVSAWIEVDTWHAWDAGEPWR